MSERGTTPSARTRRVVTCRTFDFTDGIIGKRVVACMRGGGGEGGKKPKKLKQKKDNKKTGPRNPSRLPSLSG